MEQEIGNSGALANNKAALLMELLTQKLLALDNIDTQVRSRTVLTVLSLQCSLSNVRGGTQIQRYHEPDIGT